MPHMTLAPKSLEAFELVRTMLTSMTETVVADAETELELLEGLRVLGRVTALASEVALDGLPDAPWFFNMDTPARYVGGPNPDGEYYLAMLDGTRGYRVRGRRGTSAYLGFQVLAMGTSRVLKKRSLDIVIEDARDRDVAWPGNFHLGIEVATRADLERMRADMLDAGVPMETDLFGHARGSRFFCWMPGRLMLEVNTREDAAPEFRRTFASQQG